MIHGRVRQVLAAAIIVACIAIGAVATMRNADPTPALVYAPTLPTLADSLSTDVWGVFDPKTGTVLEGSNIHAVRAIASITKLFTAAAVATSDTKDTEMTVTYADIAAEGKAGRLRAGEATTPYKLLFPLLIESSNDAAYALRRTLGASFAERTTALAEAAGLKDTDIREASGLDPLNVSTVADLAAYFAYLKRTQPHIVDITKLYTYVAPQTEYYNNNPVRIFSAFTGGKHGYTEEAGRTFVGTFRVSGSNEEIGIVLLNSANLMGDVESLSRYGSALVVSGILGDTGSAL